MNVAEIVIAVIMGLISILLLVYAFFTSKGKGPILSNTYLLASKEERKCMDKSAEYHMVTVVFGLLGIVFLLLAIEILTSWTWLYLIIGMLIVLLIIYAIAESIKTELKR
jgi:hypothetical protein